MIFHLHNCGDSMIEVTEVSIAELRDALESGPVSYTHLTLPTKA